MTLRFYHLWVPSPQATEQTLQKMGLFHPLAGGRDSIDSFLIRYADVDNSCFCFQGGEPPQGKRIKTVGQGNGEHLDARELS